MDPRGARYLKRSVQVPIFRCAVVPLCRCLYRLDPTSTFRGSKRGSSQRPQKQRGSWRTGKPGQINPLILRHVLAGDRIRWPQNPTYAPLASEPPSVPLATACSARDTRAGADDSSGK